MNKTYFKYLLSNSKKIIIVQFAILAALWGLLNISAGGLVQFLFLGGSAYHQGGESIYFLTHTIIKYYLVLSAIIYPIYFHLKNYKQNANDLYIALPIKREKRYASELLFGWIIVVFPALIITVAQMLFSYDGILLNAIVGYILGFSALYLINHLILLKANNSLDGILLVVLGLLIFYLLPTLIKTFFDSISVSEVIQTGSHLADMTYMEEGTIPFLNVLLLLVSPLYYMFNIFASASVLRMSGMVIEMLYVLLVVMLIFLNLIAFKNKRVEERGGKTTSKLCYPLVIGVGCVGFCFLLFQYANTWDALAIKFLIALIVVVALNVIVSRRLTLKVSYFAHFIIIVASIFLFRSIFISSDGFGYYENVYKDNESNLITVSVLHLKKDETFEMINIKNSELCADDHRFKEELVTFQNRIIRRFRNENRWLKNDVYNQEYRSEISIVYHEGREETKIIYRVSEEEKEELLKLLGKIKCIEMTTDWR